MKWHLSYTKEIYLEVSVHQGTFSKSHGFRVWRSGLEPWFCHKPPESLNCSLTSTRREMDHKLRFFSSHFQYIIYTVILFKYQVHCLLAWKQEGRKKKIPPKILYSQVLRRLRKPQARLVQHCWEAGLAQFPLQRRFSTLCLTDLIQEWCRADASVRPHESQPWHISFFLWPLRVRRGRAGEKRSKVGKATKGRRTFLLSA